MVKATAASLGYDKRWGDWHCLRPESSFALDGVAGSAGFRYEGGKTSYEDKVSFVRGDVRVEVITFATPDDDTHAGLAEIAQYVDLF